MDNKTIEEATAFVRLQIAKNAGNLPTWNRYNEQVEAHLDDGFGLKFKMPHEYHYAYLRGRGRSNSAALELMGIAPDHQPQCAKKKKSFWKFWE